MVAAETEKTVEKIEKKPEGLVPTKEEGYTAILKKSGLERQVRDIQADTEYKSIMDSYASEYKKGKINFDTLEGAVMSLASLKRKGISSELAKKILDDLDEEDIKVGGYRKMSLLEIIGSTHLGLANQKIELKESLSEGQKKALDSFASDFVDVLGERLLHGVDTGKREFYISQQIENNILKEGKLHGLLLTAAKVSHDIVGNKDFSYSKASFLETERQLSNFTSPEKLIKDIERRGKEYDEKFGKYISDNIYKEKSVPVLEWIPIIGAFAKYKSGDLKESILWDTTYYASFAIWDENSKDKIDEVKERMITNRLIEFAMEYKTSKRKKNTETALVNEINKVLMNNHEMAEALREKDEGFYRSFMMKTLLDKDFKSQNAEQIRETVYMGLSGRVFEAYGVKNDVAKQDLLLLGGYEIDKMSAEDVKKEIASVNAVKGALFGNENLSVKEIQQGIMNGTLPLNRQSAAYSVLHEKGYSDQSIALALYLALPTLASIHGIEGAAKFDKAVREMLTVTRDLRPLGLERDGAAIPTQKEISSMIKEDVKKSGRNIPLDDALGEFVGGQIYLIAKDRYKEYAEEEEVPVAPSVIKPAPAKEVKPATKTETVSVLEWMRQDRKEVEEIKRNVQNLALKIAGKKNSPSFAARIKGNIGGAENYFGENLVILAPKGMQGYNVETEEKFGPAAIGYYGIASWHVNNSNIIKTEKDLGKGFAGTAEQRKKLKERFDQGYDFFLKNSEDIRKNMGDAEFEKLQDAARFAARTTRLDEKKLMAAYWARQVSEYDFEKYNGGKTFIEQWYSGYKRAKAGIDIASGGYTKTIQDRITKMKLADGEYMLKVIDSSGKEKTALFEVTVEKSRAECRVKSQTAAVTTNDRVMLLDSKGNVAASSNGAVAPLLFFAPDNGIWMHNFRKNGDVEVGLTPVSGWAGPIYFKVPTYRTITREVPVPLSEEKLEAAPAVVPERVKKLVEREAPVKKAKKRRRFLLPTLPPALVPYLYTASLKETVIPITTIIPTTLDYTRLGGEVNTAGYSKVLFGEEKPADAATIGTETQNYVVQRLFKPLANDLLALPNGDGVATYYGTNKTTTVQTGPITSGDYFKIVVSKNGNDLKTLVYYDNEESIYVEVDAKIEAGTITTTKTVYSMPFAGVTIQNLMASKIGPLYVDALARVIPVYAEYQEGRVSPDKVKTGKPIWQFMATASTNARELGITLPWGANIGIYGRSGYEVPSQRFLYDYGTNLPIKLSQNMRLVLGGSAALEGYVELQSRVGDLEVSIGGGSKKTKSPVGLLKLLPYPVWLKVTHVSGNGFMSSTFLPFELVLNGEGTVSGPIDQLISDTLTGGKRLLEYTGIKSRPIKVVEQ